MKVTVFRDAAQTILPAASDIRQAFAWDRAAYPWYSAPVPDFT
jgi:hypothetical protein